MNPSTSRPEVWRSFARLLTVVVALLSAAGAEAQRSAASLVRLRGQTVDSTGRAIAGVQLQTADGVRRTESDSLGNFTFDSVRSGTVSLTSTHPQFVPLTLEIPLALDDSTVVPVMLFAVVDPPPPTLEPQLLYGIVSDARGMPVHDAEILVASTGQTAKTDSLGRFVVSKLRVAEHLVRVRKLGYYVQYIPIRTSVTSAVRVRVALESMATTLAGVTVRADRVPIRLRRFQERVEHNGWGQFLTRSQILERQAISVGDLLSRMRGVTVGADELGRPVPRNSRGCPMRIMLDGQPFSLEGASLNAMVTLNDLAGIEVYTRGDGVPLDMAFGPITNLSCGVIGLWTR
jgi:Carboxypeptidase regulatory-like domain